MATGEPHDAISYTPFAVHSSIRNVAFPFFEIKHYGVLAALVIVSTGFGLVNKDVFAAVFLMSAGYLLFAGAMARFVPYQLPLRETHIRRLKMELDKAGFLTRSEGGFVWDRQGLLTTSGDAIRLETVAGNHLLIGRKADILTISKVVERWS